MTLELGNAQITELDDFGVGEENIEALNVAMDYAVLVEELDGFADLIGIVPHIFLAYVFLPGALLFENLY